jgi:hypothetical protein
MQRSVAVVLDPDGDLILLAGPAVEDVNSHLDETHVVYTPGDTLDFSEENLDARLAALTARGFDQCHAPAYRTTFTAYSRSLLLLKHLPLLVNTLKQLVEGVYELLHPLLLQLPGDLVVVDPDIRECSKLSLRLS